MCVFFIHNQIILTHLNLLNIKLRVNLREGLGDLYFPAQSSQHLSRADPSNSEGNVLENLSFILLKASVCSLHPLVHSSLWSWPTLDWKVQRSAHLVTSSLCFPSVDFLSVDFLSSVDSSLDKFSFDSLLSKDRGKSSLSHMSYSSAIFPELGLITQCEQSNKNRAIFILGLDLLTL